MRMSTMTLLAALSAAPLAAGAQQPPMQQDQAMRMQRVQETMARMDQVMTRMRELNQMLTQRQAQQGLRLMGENMERACERLQVMLREMEQLHRDPALQRDQDRLRQMDELHDRLREMLRQMDQARELLHTIAMP